MTDSASDESKEHKAAYLFAGSAGLFLAAIVIGTLFPGTLIPFIFFAGGLVSLSAGGIITSSVTYATKTDHQTEQPKPVSSERHVSVENALEHPSESVRPLKTPPAARSRPEPSVRR